MKKCKKPELEIIAINKNDILRTSACDENTEPCPTYGCTSVYCNLQGCPKDECSKFDW